MDTCLEGEEEEKREEEEEEEDDDDKEERGGGEEEDVVFEAAIKNSGGRVGGSGKREDMSERWCRKGSSSVVGNRGELIFDPASDGSLRSVGACVLHTSTFFFIEGGRGKRGK